MTVAVGDQLEPFIVEAVPVAGMKLVAALMNDPNPIHLEGAAVRSLGLGDRTVNQGPITISYLQTMIARAVGGAHHIVRFQARFLDNLFAGDRVECSGSVIAVDGDTGLAIVECLAAVAGRPVAQAVARVSWHRIDEEM